MAQLGDTRIRVIKADEVEWEEAARNPGEVDPAGRECTAATSIDDRFSFGLWQRDVQQRHFERPYHEVAYIVEGQVEVTDDDGNVYVAGPGDILITPKGSAGYWKNLSPVKKVWGIYEEADADLSAYIGPGGF